MIEGLLLAPMVRVGTLPLRTMALRYGADWVWSPEIIDKKLLSTSCAVGSEFVDFTVVREGKNNATFSSSVLKLRHSEKERLIIQLGSSTPELAVKAALMVEDHCAGIDLNCGCPKWFSVHSGMGAALLREKEKLVSILSALRSALSPKTLLSCKIRVLSSKEDTLELVKAIILSKTISSLTVHFRTPDERPRDAAHYEFLEKIIAISSCVNVHINGDIGMDAFVVDGNSDSRAVGARTSIRKAEKFMALGAKGLMIGRVAQWNPSIFALLKGRIATLVDCIPICLEYIEEAKLCDNPFKNTKFCIIQILSGYQMIMGKDQTFHLLMQRQFRTKDIKEMEDIFRNMS